MLISFRYLQRALTLLGILFLSGPMHANYVQELSLQEKVRRSTIVFIGRVTSVTEEPCFNQHRCAEVEILDVLKGKKTETVRVLWGGPITEFDPACCEVGDDYLFFLKRKRGAFFETVNAYHGVYPLPKSDKPLPTR